MRSVRALGTSLAAAAAAALLAPAPVRAQLEGRFSTLTYNIAGLPEPLSSSSPAANTPVISCLIRPFDVVNVQEDFNYHADLYDRCDDHAFRTATSGGVPFGSGLNTLSNLAFSDLTRVGWNQCDGVDCLTPKGFSLARLRLAEGVYVDLYNLHAQAEVTDGALASRRADILQLAAYIVQESTGNAVIVMGDTNTRYTRTGDNIRTLTDRGLRDVWVDLLRGGALPELGAPALEQCSPYTSASCEVVDKVLYRSNDYVKLSPQTYRLLDQTFVDAQGAPLSDHIPVTVDWSYTTAADRRLSDPVGGPHGTNFNDLVVLQPGVTPSVNAIGIRAGSRLDQVNLTLAGRPTVMHGGSGGTAMSLALASGELVTGAELCTGEYEGSTRVFFARFTTSAGRSLQGGARTGSCVTQSAPAGWQLVGFHGRSGAEVDKLGLIFAPRP